MTSSAIPREIPSGKDKMYYINIIRGLAVDIVEKANSGHPGMPLGMAPVAHILQSEFLKYDPQDSSWFDRDRFVLSNGHGCALLYSMLHICGYNLPMEELQRFRQLHSKTPGHPERGHTDGVEVTTGPLGQGIANAVGMAIAESHLAARFNKPEHKVVDHFTFAFCGDGCLMEGISQEALSLAGHLGLEKLIIIYDDNHITIDGSTDLAYTEKKVEKYESLGFNCLVVEDGNNDVVAIREALIKAKCLNGKPTMIHLRTTIGYGSPLQGTAKVHGAPLGPNGVISLKKELGLCTDKTFHIPEDVYSFYSQVAKANATEHQAWDSRMAAYALAFPEEAKELNTFIQGKLPNGWDTNLPKNDKAIATRKASENVLNQIVPSITNLIGGSADLAPSNLTKVSAHTASYQKATPEGRYLYFGVREHAMVAICNGLQAHGGCIPYCATFLTFVGYAMGALRLSALSGLGIIFLATHDGIGLGEDGPTHQPVELAPALRAIPNLNLFRPADQIETNAAWIIAIENRTTPSVIALSRQNLTPLKESSLQGVRHGAYSIRKCPGNLTPKLILIGTGSEVQYCVEAAELLAQEGLEANVVSMPCMRLFDAQSKEYRDSILLPGVPCISVEAWTTFGWAKYAHYSMGIDTFGTSAPAEQAYLAFGISSKEIVTKSKALLEFYKGQPVPVYPTEL